LLVFLFTWLIFVIAALDMPVFANLDVVFNFSPLLGT